MSEPTNLPTTAATHVTHARHMMDVLESARDAYFGRANVSRRVFHMTYAAAWDAAIAAGVTLDELQDAAEVAYSMGPRSLNI